MVKIALLVLATLVVVNVAAWWSPYKPLIWTMDRKFIADHDIQFDVPAKAGRRWDGRVVRRGRVCIYWRGAALTRAIFIDADRHCSFFT
ncbi:hypothetical protein [Sphingomonas sp.]|jgi:hypothetical protein|uniref:hypothetical protein n=1 Tax=Sphingomonas sp. TaxID=28214 RepID=UPI002D7F9B06|nr:hypothetical protein [Sphingomonas sp.]HEU0044112.1 hypothetical protein [Sphingomonas sp.]